MRERGRRTTSFDVCRVAIVLLSAAGRLHGEEAGDLVRVGNGLTALAVRSAIQGAARRLGSPSCGKLLTEFTDREGRTLQSNLVARGLTAEAHLRGLMFYDGVRLSRCERVGIFAVTAPGSSVVFVCSQAFLTAHRRNAYLAESYIIHEMLHTLGLGENPPRSDEITDRVNAACRN